MLLRIMRALTATWRTANAANGRNEMRGAVDARAAHPVKSAPRVCDALRRQPAELERKGHHEHLAEPEGGHAITQQRENADGIVRSGIGLARREHA